MIGSMDVELEPNYLIIVTIRGTVLSKLRDKLHAFSILRTWPRLVTHSHR